MPFYEMSMITGLQIRAARACLRWSVNRLSEEANVAVRTISRLEEVDGVPPSRSSTLNDVQKAFENAGVEFIGGADDSPGVRISAAKG